LVWLVLNVGCKTAYKTVPWYPSKSGLIHKHIVNISRQGTKLRVSPVRSAVISCIPVVCRVMRIAYAWRSP
jgi:hypothetical protein